MPHKSLLIEANMVMFSIGQALVLLVSVITSCFGTACISVTNPDFEQDSINASYKYMMPFGWNGTVGHGVVIAQQGNRPWGGLNTSNSTSSYYAVLQRQGTALWQDLHGFIPGSQYKIAFRCAERPGYGSNESLSVSIGNATVISHLDPFGTFYLHDVEFTATSTTMRLEFTNVSPVGQDLSVFVDDVTVCALPPTCTTIQNGGFEVDAHGQNFVYMCPSGWICSGGTVVAANGNAPWGRMDSGNGAYYLVLQGSGALIEQQLAGLQFGMPYNLSFVTAERPGYGHNETMAVYLNNIPLVGAASIDPGDTFATMWFTFTAASRNLLTFTNISPPRQDSSVFVDAVQVCATGASTGNTSGVNGTSTTATPTTDDASKSNTTVLALVGAAVGGGFLGILAHVLYRTRRDTATRQIRDRNYAHGTDGGVEMVGNDDTAALVNPHAGQEDEPMLVLGGGASTAQSTFTNDSDSDTES